MEEYVVTIDGQKYRVKSETPLTDAQAYQYATQQVQQSPSEVTMPEQKTTNNVSYSPQKEVLRSALQGLTLGFEDEIEAAVRTGKTSGQEYEKLRDRLRAQQSQFQKDYPLTSVGSQISGGIALPAVGALRTTQAPNILQSAATSAALGGIQGAGMSQSQEDLMSDIAGGTALGGAFGGTLGTIGAAIAPKVQPGARMLQREGVQLTPGAAFGGQTQALEQAAESVPVLGRVIQSARRESMESFNRAAFNRALKQIDNTLQVPKDLPTRQAADFTASVISKEYDDIYPQVKLELDKNLTNQLNAIKSRYTKGKIGEENYQQLTNRIDEIKNSFGGAPLIGARIKALKQELATDAAKYQQTTGGQNLLADAFNDLEDSFMKSIRLQNPDFASRLKKTDAAYANYKRAESAAVAGRGTEGIFTPLQLETAVRQADKSKGKSQYARGKALMQDLAATGTDILGQKIPDSGTANRIGVAGLLTGAAYALNPKAAIPAALASSLYTRPGMEYLTPLLTAPRPALIERAAPAVRGALPLTTPIANTLLQGLLENE